MIINPGVKIKVGIYVFGGLFLFEKNDFMTIKQIKNFIYEIDDCINDLKHFSKHQNEFVYDGDVALFNNEMHQLMQHKTFFHNLQYRWLDKQGKPIWINCRGKVIDVDQQSYLVGCINEIGKKQRADNLSVLFA